MIGCTTLERIEGKLLTPRLVCTLGIMCADLQCTVLGIVCATVLCVLTCSVQCWVCVC